MAICSLGPNFSIYFDGFRVYITLGPAFINQTRGLCGTFNYITRDDYQTPNGLIETNLIGFADAYKISQTCVTPLQTTSCSLFPSVRKRALRRRTKDTYTDAFLVERIGCSNHMSEFVERSRVRSLCRRVRSILLH